MEAYWSLDGLRAAMVLTLAVGQAVMANWPDLRRWPATIASRSAAQQTSVVPVSWAFAIWGLIFLGCLVFAVWHALPFNLSDPLLRTVGWLAICVFAINIAWEYHVPMRDIDATSVALIILALVALLAILFRLEDAEPLAVTDRWMVAAPFQIFAGWISAATFVNLSSTLRLNGVAITTPRALLLMTCAVALGALIAFVTGAILYGLVVSWALFGIFIANRSKEGDRRVGLLAAIAIPVAPIAALAGAAA